MIEKVNPMHPDKLADRIAGAMVDQRYTVTEVETDCCDCECFICKRMSRDYDIDKKPKR